MSFPAFCGRLLLSCFLPVIVLFAGIALTGNAIKQAQIPPPAVDGFAGLLLVLSLVWASRFYPAVEDVQVVFVGGFADANNAFKRTFKIALLAIVLMSLPEGWRQYIVASRTAAAQSADSVFIGAFSAAIWQFCNQLWYRAIFPGLLALPVGLAFAVRALMKDAEKQRQGRAASME